MITAFSPTLNKSVRVHGLCNKGQWFGRTWLVGIGAGFSTMFFLVEGDNESDVIDTFTDSKYGHLVKLTPDEAENLDPDFTTFAGNNSHAVCLDDVRILERTGKVNYFAKRDEEL